MSCDKCEECRSEGCSYCEYCGESLQKDCDRCAYCRENGYLFCDGCGRKLGAGCSHCRESAMRGFRFCKYCGTPIRYEQRQVKRLTDKEILSGIVFYTGLCIMAVLTVLLVTQIFTAAWGFADVFSNISDKKTTLYLVFVKLFNVVQIKDGVFQGYWVLICIILAISMIVLFSKTIGSLQRYSNTKNRDEMKNNALFEVAVLFGALYLVEFIFILLLNAFGVNTSSPIGDEPRWELMYELLNASVYEELVTRTLYLGIPMAIVCLVRKNKDRPLWKNIFGGFGIDRVSLIFIILSAFMFGTAHVGSWGLWKFFPTFLFGLITGYLYCKYGIYATITFHFMTDYLQAESWLTGTNSAILTSLMLILVMLASIPYVYVYAKRCFLYVKGLFQPKSDLKRS